MQDRNRYYRSCPPPPWYHEPDSDWCPPGRLAEAYVPWHKYGRTFSPEEALEKGTIFPNLYRPYKY